MVSRDEAIVLSLANHHTHYVLSPRKSVAKAASWKNRLMNGKILTRRMWRHLLQTICMLGLLQAGLEPAVSCAQELVSTSRDLPRIEAGTRIEDAQDQYWNRIVLLARPRISSGDIESLPSVIRNSVSEFVLTIMASVEQVTDPANGQMRYRLMDIGVGYSTMIDGTLRAVTVADAERLGVDLGLFPRMMLSENEKQLTTARIIARTSTLMIIDTPAFVLRGQQHREYTMRHFVWVDPQTGRNAALVWLIDRDAVGNPVVEMSEPARWAPAGLQEDRAIHVDGQEFNMFGIPNKKAFAIENLPPGKEVPWTEAARHLAPLDTYDAQSLRELSTALNDMLQAYARE